MKTYMIMRFRMTKNNICIRRGLTLEQAQEWCNREEAQGDDWFDDYVEDW